jgi:hypothetical protein
LLSNYDGLDNMLDKKEYSQLVFAKSDIQNECQYKKLEHNNI